MVHLLVHLRFLCSGLARPPVRQLKGPAWLGSCRGLQKRCRSWFVEKPSSTLEELENSGSLGTGPEELTLPTLSLQQRS